MCTNACICMGTHSQPLLQKCSLYLGERSVPLGALVSWLDLLV